MQARVNEIVQDDGQDGKPDKHEEDTGHVQVCRATLGSESRMLREIDDAF